MLITLKVIRSPQCINIIIFVLTTHLEMSARTQKDRLFIARMSSDLKSKLAEAAKRDGTSMSKYVERLLIKDLRARNLTR